MDILEDVGRQASLGEDLGDPGANEGRLRGGLENDRVTNEKGGDKGVDDNEVGKLARFRSE